MFWVGLFTGFVGYFLITGVAFLVIKHKTQKSKKKGV